MRIEALLTNKSISVDLALDHDFADIMEGESNSV